MTLAPIFLVEDNDIDAEAVRRALKKANIGNPLHLARDGVEALEMLTDKNGKTQVPQPCIMLLDINMPRMNGFELLETIRRDDKMKQNVVFILTTSARSQDKLTAYNLGAAGYVLKENIDAFTKMLSDYCQVSELPD